MTETLSLNEVESKSALSECLRPYPQSVLVGLGAEAPCKFYRVVLPAPWDKQVGAGVYSSGFGIKPMALLLGDPGRMVVGHDCSVSVVSLGKALLEYSCTLPSVFRAFARIKTNGALVVVHELGLLEIERDGSVHWSVDTEIIGEFSIHKDRISIIEMESGRKIEVSLESGKGG